MRSKPTQATARADGQTGVPANTPHSFVFARFFVHLNLLALSSDFCLFTRLSYLVMLRIRPSLRKTIYAILLFLILAFIPLITYVNTLHNDFVFDDLLIIQGNETLSSLKSISSIINLLTKKHVYRPVRTLSYSIDYHFSGLNPFSYHISNIVCHIIKVRSYECNFLIFDDS